MEYRIKIETEMEGNILYTPQVKTKFHDNYENINEHYSGIVETSFTTKSSYYKEEDALILIEKHKLQNIATQGKKIIQTTYKEVE